LTITGNNLKTLTGLHEELNYLDASANPLGNLGCLKGATGLMIAIFKASFLSDITGLKVSNRLVYVDISENRLTDDAFDYIRQARLLQFVQASENQFYAIPDFENLMLYGFDLSFNMIQVLKIESFLGNLRVIHISNSTKIFNKDSIHDIQPLTMAPLLKELLVANNSLKGNFSLPLDVGNLYAIAVSQYLEVLDITGNPVMNDERYPKIVGTLCRNLKVYHN
jgi:hypothetical protein